MRQNMAVGRLDAELFGKLSWKNREGKKETKGGR